MKTKMLEEVRKTMDENDRVKMISKITLDENSYDGCRIKFDAQTTRDITQGIEVGTLKHLVINACKWNRSTIGNAKVIDRATAMQEIIKNVINTVERSYIEDLSTLKHPKNSAPAKILRHRQFNLRVRSSEENIERMLVLWNEIQSNEEKISTDAVYRKQLHDIVAMVVKGIGQNLLDK